MDLKYTIETDWEIPKVSMHNLSIEGKDAVRDLFLQQFDKGGICAEIGVGNGVHACSMRSHLKPSELILIDKKFPDNTDHRDYHYLKDLKDDDDVHFLEMTSQSASVHFKDNYFDFVYLDSSIAYNDVLLDLYHWLPKVKENGFICGNECAFSIDMEFSHLDEIGSPESKSNNNGRSFISRINKLKKEQAEDGVPNGKFRGGVIPAVIEFLDKHPCKDVMQLDLYTIDEYLRIVTSNFLFIKGSWSFSYEYAFNKISPISPNYSTV